MTFEEFIKECRKLDGWAFNGAGSRGIFRKRRDLIGMECPVTAVANLKEGRFKYSLSNWPEAAVIIGLSLRTARSIVRASDGVTMHGSYRRALLGLVQP